MYDGANRLTSIEHKDAIGNTILKLDYQYLDNDLASVITESDISGWLATVTLGYDTRGRLISEVRTGQSSYDLAYEYDQGGNRTKKTRTISRPLVRGSLFVRLPGHSHLRQRRQPPDEVRVVEVFADDNLLWADDAGVRGDGAGLRAYVAREFRYDSARQRYLNRKLNPAVLGDTGELVTLSETWSDYDGNNIYGDFTVTGGVPMEARSYEPGIAKVDPWQSSGSLNTKYYHADMIGTTREMTDSSGTGVSPVVYTAFGENVSGSARPYGYAGAWGYQTHDDFPFLHVGARYYDPATGRFLQRDPIGIRGGTNVYSYASNMPTVGGRPGR